MKITLNPLAILCLVTLFLLGACNDNAPENKVATPDAANKSSTAAPQPSTAPQPTAIDKAKEANKTMENATTEKKQEIDKPK